MPKCAICQLCGCRHLSSRSCVDGSRIVFYNAARRGEMYESASYTTWQGHHSAGSMCNVCPYCNSRRWSKDQTQCCEAGKVCVNVAYDSDIPDSLLAVLRDSRVLDNIRQYNMAVAMASVGHKRHNFHGGPCDFILGGRSYHRISGAAHNGDAKFAQIYTLAVEDAVDRRMEVQHHRLHRDLLRCLHLMLLEYNPWVRQYVAAAHQSEPLSWKWDGSEEMNDAMIIGALIAEHGSHRDIKLCQSNGDIIFINDGHRLYHPLAYPLLFPSGQVGWHWGMKKSDGSRMTLTSYMKFILMHRQEPSYIQRCGKLALEFYCDAWATIESHKCHFHRLPSQQQRYRSCSRHALIDQLQYADATDIGTPVQSRTVLPASHVGSPRYYHKLFQNAMALPRRFGRPDLFITMTCNPTWSEIVTALPEGSTWQEHPDIVARVFMMKVASLLDDIKNKKIFGDAAAIVYRIEWQSRGLPHMHMLVILASHINSVEDVDSIVSAEIPDPDTHPMLHELVKQFHIHRPCDTCGDASCRQKSTDGSCYREFPKKMIRSTNLPVDGFPLYRRRGRFHTNVKDHSGIDRVVTDEWVVSYSPFLLLRYRCHINVEVAGHLCVFKYVYKYVFKAPDSAAICVDEISAYLQGRLLTASEAVFRILGLSLHGEWPPVIALDIHLPQHERMVFDPTMDRVALLQMTSNTSRTMLTAWFHLNETDESARQFLYNQIPEHYVWDGTARRWTNRTFKSMAVGRIYSVAVANVELFALRQLLDHVRGCVSFRDLLHVNGVIHGSFVQACIARGLRDCDDAIMCTLQELFSVNVSPVQCREHFAHVLLHCDVSNATHLFAAFSHHLYDEQTSTAQSALAHIDSVLRLSNHTIADYGFDAVNHADVTVDNYNSCDVDTYTQLAAELHSLCTIEQTAALEAVRRTLESSRSGQNVFIVAGPAGTGKTLWTNALTATLRSQGYNVMCVASSALAASLMLDGKTAHSALRIPIPAHEDSFCSWDAIKRKELRKIRVLIWDEMSMINKHVANVVDASFRDLHCSNSPFGGITVVFVGDFQQLPPVVPRGKGEHSTIHNCDWFNDAYKTTFTCNWRAAANPAYSSWLERVGNGTETQVQLPHQCSCESAAMLIQRVYGNDEAILTNYSGRMILSLTVADARAINEMVINMIPVLMEFAAANDKIPVQDTVPPEYVSGLPISGVPEFNLPMKIGARYMILKNYKTGVCNGVLCILKAFSRYIAQVQLLTGPRAGSIIPLPRVAFNVAASTSGLPFDFVRTQFPITLAYCVTVHKAQGQTLQTVGLYFTGETFAHGQLYVALSRVGSWERICATRVNFENVVYRFLLS
jgi:hypothetical protein